jgi:hypothetical protein
VVAELLAAGASDCERISSGFFAQPINAISSVAYVIVGVWVVARFPRTVARVFGLFVVFVGVGSIGYHGWDDGSVDFVHDLAFPGALGFIALYELTHLRSPRRAAGYWVGGAAFGLGLIGRLVGATDGPWCAPGSVVQWHAFWHMATAVALGAWAWGAFGGEWNTGEEVRWDGSTARRRSSPVPARASGGE